MPYFQKKNCSRTSLASGITAGATSITVSDVSALPASPDFLLTIWNKNVYPDPCDDSSREIVRVTGIAGSVLTVTRAQEDTTAVVHSSGHAVELLFTAGQMEELETAIDAKADTSHTHTASDVTDFDTEVSNNADVTDSLKKTTDDSDDITEGTTNLFLTSAERTKLTGIETGATADQSASEVDTDQSGVTVQNALDNKLENIVEDLTPQFGGEVDAQDNTIGFTLQTLTIGSGGTTPVDWRSGNKAKVVLDQNVTFSFTDPSNPCNLLLVLEQDASGGGTATWPASVKWPEGTAPTLTPGGVDIVSLFFDGTDYYAVGSLNFS